MTIYDIAKALGYSPSTVARALSSRGYVSAKARKEILEFANKHGYQPNISAKTLRDNMSRKILFCIPDIYNPFYFKMIDGASNVLEENSYYTILYHTKNQVAKEISAIDLLNQKYCDGIILVSFDFSDKNISSIEASKRPVVLTNLYEKIKPNSNFDCVYVDHEKGMKMAAEHLISEGSKKILLLIGSLDLQTSRERLQGYKIGLAENNIPFEENLVKNGMYTVEGGYSAIQQAIDENIDFDAIITANDLMGVGVIQFLNENNIKLGDKYKMVSFDNTDFARYAVPSITSIDLQQYLIGKYSAELLLERILTGRKKSKVIRIEPKLIIRESSVIN
jgi:DNA-binding LacI/PurR family transcriptional regulator